jgi:hypothetical protein
MLNPKNLLGKLGKIRNKGAILKESNCSERSIIDRYRVWIRENGYNRKEGSRKGCKTEANPGCLQAVISGKGFQFDHDGGNW